MSPRLAKLLIILLIVGAGLLGLFPALGQQNRWASHETRHGQIAREMWQMGNYAVPRFLGQVYGDKPPFFHWLAAGSFALFGRANEFTMRLPSALAGILGAVGLFALGSIWYDRRVALLASLILLTTYTYVHWSQMCRMDIVMSVALLWMLLFLVWGIQARGWRRWLCVESAALLLTAAMLSKGFPPLLTGIGLMGIVWWRMNGGARPFLIVMALVSATVAGLGAVWIGHTLGSGFLPEFIRFQLDSPDSKHASPFWYYISKLPRIALPWSIFLPAALWRFGRNGFRQRGFKNIALMLTAAAVLFFSLSSNKRYHYLLPILPFVALIEAEWIVHWLRTKERPAGLKALLLGLLVLSIMTAPLALSLTALVVSPATRAWTIIVAALMALTVMAGLQRLRAKRPFEAFLAIPGFLLLLAGPGQALLVNRLLPPEREVAETRALSAFVGDLPCGVREYKELLPFTLPQPVNIDTQQQAMEFAQPAGEVALVVPKSYLPAIKESLQKRSMAAMSMDTENGQVVALRLSSIPPQLPVRALSVLDNPEGVNLR